MFVGHYAAALAGKTLAPKAPLWSYAFACQGLDLAWGAFVAVGIEKVRVDPSLPGSPLDLYFMPFTHSLPAAIGWSILWMLGARALRLNWGTAAMIGAVVFSHWILDLLVHRPDLKLGFGAGKVGLGLWNFPLPEMTLEMGLLVVAGAIWAAWRRLQGGGVWSAALFLGFLAGLQLLAEFAGPKEGADALMIGLSTVGVYAAASFAAWLADRGASTRAQAAPHAA